jgi:hypothetical protein
MSVDTAAPIPNAPLTHSAAPTSRSGRGARGAHWLFGAFFACTLAIPAAPVNKGLFALLGLWLLWDHYRYRAPHRFPSMAPLIIVGIFAYGFALALVNRVDMPIAMQFLFATFVLPLIYFISAHEINMDRLAVRGSYLLVACTALFWITLLLPDLPFAGPINRLLVAYNLSSASDREFFEGGTTFTLQLGTAPFLFVGFCVLGMRLITPKWRKRDWVGLLLIFAAIVVTGQRALIGITLLYVGYLWLTATQERHRWLVMVALAVAAVAMWVVVFADSQVFSTGEESNQVKIGHFLSFIDDLTPASALFGNGLASYYYSSGSHAMKAHTELTPIDVCRYVGIPLAAMVYACLLLPLRGLWRLTLHRWGYTVAILLFTALSMTNPVMFNSYGLLVVIWYWCSLVPTHTASVNAGHTP